VTKQTDDEYATWVRDALKAIANQSAGSNAPERNHAEVMSTLERLLNPVICRRLGIYDWPPDFLLSVVIPVFNEEATIATLISRVLQVNVPCEIIVVDDGSSDQTAELLTAMAEKIPLRLFRHDHNQGKGAAIRTGIGQVRGNVVLIQDGDLEYDPNDYPLLLRPILENRADVVYGSRFSSNDRPVAKYWHQTGNRFVTLLSNMFTNLKLTDVETCYKVMRCEHLQQILPTLRENGFGIELELTAKLAKIEGVRFYELPISYSPRGYAEGKKIGWRDGARAIWCVIRYAFGS